MADKTLVPIEQKQVVFYDDEIIAVLVQLKGAEKVYVPVRPICEFLGVSWTGQLSPH
ncbi:MAG: phage antirepressor N-terminal domain-containing protein [Chloroflexi bacterium]|nr:phage antirepressor N-terminal domain-containing protein [Chloroflexota bacterium]